MFGGLKGDRRCCKTLAPNHLTQELGNVFFGAFWNGMMFDSLGSAAQKILSDRRFDVFFLKMFDFLRYVLSDNMKETDA